MRRGTTPQIKLTIKGINLELLETIIVTVQQGQYQINKSGEDLSINYEDNVITVSLTQEETLNFKANNSLQIQLRGVTNEDKVIATNISQISIGQILYDKEIENTKSNVKPSTTETEGGEDNE